jgi:hypothetical protein
MRAKLKMVKDQLRRRRYQPIPEQGRWLAAVVRGHQAYYAVPGNNRAVNAFRTQAARHWHHALQRRSQKSQLPWTRMNRIVTRWLPPTRTLYPFPEVRFAAQLPKARAQCGSPARWDLRGGPPARAVPTATALRLALAHRCNSQARQTSGTPQVDLVALRRAAGVPIRSRWPG